MTHGRVGVWSVTCREGRHDPLAFFVPVSVADPSVRPAGEELSVEVTIPRRDPPRPIRLAVRKNGTLTELALR